MNTVRKWSAAIFLALISSCLHVTDHKQKFGNIARLVKVMCRSKSTIVKGTCGVILGFSCHDLLSRADAADNYSTETDSEKMSERNLLGDIGKALLGMRVWHNYFPPSRYDIDKSITAKLSNENCDNSLKDIGGIAGLVLGLASSIGALHNAGVHDAILKIKDIVISWVQHMNILVQGSFHHLLQWGITLFIFYLELLMLVLFSDEATFREVQGRKMELHQAILKMEQRGSADGILQVQADCIQYDLEELIKALTGRCKKHGLDMKLAATIELPIGWQPDIQDGTSVWDED
ncbi:hypothetical protein RchiOBHm_Chr5g0081041 [Rosa chinensis]|uniref:Uncharacterized protein n=1 Tax=Rosa chinensis TaxID=74649 RepID=A0A2P6QMX0_ROSCH|nr:hypothetical protein RchiOBHm_Chr5g0081041 [Rosa chinensis]